jgi:hypothetical protein
MEVMPAFVSGFVTNGVSLTRSGVPGEICWGSFVQAGVSGLGRFESAPISATRFPFLDFRIAGDLGKPGLSLSILDLHSGKTKSVAPPKPPGPQWQTYRIKAPRGEFKIIAEDASEKAWFAFQPPREIGWLSMGSESIEEMGRFAFNVGAVLYLFLISFTWRKAVSNGKSNRKT